jgi:hypothetical protein
MAKDPVERYPSAGDLGAAALAAARPSEPERPTVRMDGPGPLRSRRSAVAAALVALAIPAALVLAGAFDTGEDPSPGPRPLSALLEGGTLVRERESGRVYVLKAGAKFPISAAQRDAFGYDPADARTLSRRALDAIPDVPRDGSFIRTHHGTTVWEVRGGKRHLADKPPGADVAVIPRSALLGIPPPAGGRRTSTTMTAPATIYERRKFLLIADVRSNAGVPEGACVFYRIALSGLKERANMPTNDGRCVARLRVSGMRTVRYSVHFVGGRGWRGSQAVTGPIPVTAQP